MMHHRAAANPFLTLFPAFILPLTSDYPFGTSVVQSSVKPALVALSGRIRKKGLTDIPSKPFMYGQRLDWPEVPMEAYGKRTFTIIARVTSDAVPGTLLNWNAFMYQNVAPGFPYWYVCDIIFFLVLPRELVLLCICPLMLTPPLSSNFPPPHPIEQ